MSFVSNLVGFTRKSMLPKVGKSDTYNMYVESKDAGEHAFSVILRPMPGYATVSDLPVGLPQGTYRCSRGYDGRPTVYGVWGSKVYLPFAKSKNLFSRGENFHIRQRHPVLGG